MLFCKYEPNGYAARHNIGGSIVAPSFYIHTEAMGITMSNHTFMTAADLMINTGNNYHMRNSETASTKQFGIYLVYFCC
jgi:hypothetical protein